MKINFITLFPNFYNNFMNESIIKRASSSNLVNFNVIDLRNFALGKHKKVDDTIFGGGNGMLLMIEPIDKALSTVKGKKILLSPQGKLFTQKMALELSDEKELTFIAGRYEGFDKRVRNLVDIEISIGDYVLTGGELPSMVMADAIIRLLPKVIKKGSIENDTFKDNLLDYDQYTKPKEYKGSLVPEILLNGNHANINKWRHKNQIDKTKKKRPDLYKKYVERRKDEK